MFQTYNTDFQVPDSAGTATALVSGVKTRMGMLGLDGTAKYNVCDVAVVETARVDTLLDWAVGAGVRAVYSGDGREYEGSVVFVNKANRSVTVR